LKIERLIGIIKEIKKEAVTGILTIILHEGGIRKIKLEKDIK